MALRAALLSAALAAASTSAGAAVPAGLDCRLQAPSRVVAGEPAPLTWHLGNPGAHAVDFLIWGTPFEPAWFAPYVRVTRGGTALAYRGAAVKRGDPQRADYLRLDAGERRSASVDLAQVFDLGVPGRYRAVPVVVLHDLVVAASAAALPRPRESHQGAGVACDPVEFDVVAR